MIANTGAGEYFRAGELGENEEFVIQLNHFAIEK
jgi:hypothetical protein